MIYDDKELDERMEKVHAAIKTAFPNFDQNAIRDRLLRQNVFRIVEFISKSNDSHVMCIDGDTGSGKSTLASQIVYYSSHIMVFFNPQKGSIFDVKQLCVDADSFLKYMQENEYTASWLDEAGAALFSRDANRKMSKKLVKVFTMLRVKHFLTVICIPSFYFLDSYARNVGINSLIHCHKVFSKKGFFKCYNRQQVKWLSNMRSNYKDYNLKKSDSPNVQKHAVLKGRFHAKNPYGKQYETISNKYKMDFIRKVDEEDKNEKRSVQIEQRNRMILHLANVQNKMLPEIEKITGMKQATIRKVIKESK